MVGNAMTEKTGRFAIIEQFLADGIDHMFGNPGTVEQGFLDALSAYPEMRYVLTLQESVAVLDRGRLRTRDTEACASATAQHAGRRKRYPGRSTRRCAAIRR